MPNTQSELTMQAAPDTQDGPDTQPDLRVKSPCIGVCRVDGRHGYCIGCWRTLGEIAKWSRFSETERETVLAALPGRQAGRRSQ